ncbi:MAG: hypothetical protein RSA15_00315 [Bacilli bacterium]
MKKLILILFCFTLINVKALDIESKNAILYNMNENKIIYSKNENEITKIASLTKIMTCLIAIENTKNLSEVVIMTKDMFKGLDEQNAYQVGLKVGDIVTKEDLLYTSFIASGADATMGLVLSITNSEEEYLKLMNEKATSIGLKNTVFKNTIGLDKEGQTSTVKEVAETLKYALKNETFKKIFETNSYTLSNNKITVYSSLKGTASKFGISVPYIIGGKTGYTKEAGRCLASVAVDTTNNIKYLLVTTNASTTPQHVTDAETIYNYYFENYKYHKVLLKDTEILNLKVNNSKIKEIKIKASQDYESYLDNSFDIKDIELVYKGKEEVDYKTKKGDNLGTLSIIYKDKNLKDIKITMPESVNFSIISFIFDNNIRKVIFISLIVIILIIMGIKKR